MDSNFDVTYLGIIPNEFDSFILDGPIFNIKLNLQDLNYTIENVVTQEVPIDVDPYPKLVLRRLKESEIREALKVRKVAKKRDPKVRNVVTQEEPINVDPNRILEQSEIREAPKLRKVANKINSKKVLNPHHVSITRKKQKMVWTKRSLKICVAAWECKDCHKDLRSKYSLKRHRRICAAKRVYECALCKKRFANQGSFTGHKGIHSSEQVNRPPNFLLSTNQTYDSDQKLTTRGARRFCWF